MLFIVSDRIEINFDLLWTWETLDEMYGHSCWDSLISVDTTRMCNWGKQDRNTSYANPHSKSYPHSKTNVRAYLIPGGNSDAYYCTGIYSNSDYTNTNRDA